MAVDQIALAEVRERIVSYATSRGCARQDSEDLAQETLMILVDKYADRPKPELMALAFPICVNLFRNLIRRRYVRAPHLSVDDMPLAHPGENPETAAIRGEQLEALGRALGKLGEPCRTFVRLRLQGLTLEEIKDAAKAESMNTVYTWNARCPKRVIQLLAGGK
jgi:RNA polymerase sigma-70 factor (ECF subfamily)